MKQKILIFLITITSFIYINYFYIYEYSSNVIFSIRNIDDNGIGNPLSLFSKQVDIPISKNISVLEKYLNSKEVFDKINKKFHLKKIYKNTKKTNIIDRINLTYNEDYLELYRKNLKFTPEEELIIIDFTSHDKVLSKDIVSFLLKTGEIFLNKLEDNKIKKNLFYLSKDVKDKELKLRILEKDLNDFQNKNLIIDPNLEFKSEFKFKTELKLEKMKKEAEYNTKKTYMSKKSPQLLELKSYIYQLNKNIQNIKNNIYGKKDKLISKMIKFEELKQRVMFQLELYKTTLTNYELALIQNNKNKEYIEVITKPTISDKYIYPEKTKFVFIVFLFTLLLLYIYNSINKLIKEHKE